LLIYGFLICRRTRLPSTIDTRQSTIENAFQHSGIYNCFLAPTVSIVVPARNEEACLGACLESLLAQKGADFEVIVVDDSSSDRTRAIAESFSGARVISPGPLADGSSGKCNAAQAGADVAGGEWLLFTDADTVHLPGSLARALAEAREHRADLLSYSPQQEVHGLIERSLMTVIFAELAVTYRAKDVSDPTSAVAAANGQYLLISREAYNAVGGHAAVARTLLEDVALAQAVKRSGRRLRFHYGGDMVRTRMYRNLPALWEGWTKNLALLFPQTVQLAARRGIEFLLAAAGIAAAAAGLARVSHPDRFWKGGPSSLILLFAGLLVAVPT
jgi:cellulose synthase/poly-beta-1,6-N-acetylglucosamine synthase-like glycosyltransferase